MSQKNLTTLTHALRDGQLEHVVVVNGAPVQAHTSLKAAACALMLALALQGCTACREYPTACAAVTLVAAGSLALMAGPHGNSSSSNQHDAQIPGLDCSKVDCR